MSNPLNLIIYGSLTIVFVVIFLGIAETVKQAARSLILGRELFCELFFF